MEWTPEAEARLKEIPFFVRPAARKKIEKFAQEQGLNQISEATYEAAEKAVWLIEIEKWIEQDLI